MVVFATWFVATSFVLQLETRKVTFVVVFVFPCSGVTVSAIFASVTFAFSLSGSWHSWTTTGSHTIGVVEELLVV